MSQCFLRPVGAVADFNELEYIAALHQSCKEVDENFEDGSIDADDVAYFLLSRHGITVTPETVRKVIFPGIAGGDDEDACLDIAEVVSLLIIPLLLSVAKKNEQGKGTTALKREDFVSKWKYDRYLRNLEVSAGMVPPESVIQDMLSIILKKSLGYVPSEPPILTKELIQTMFAAYNETELLEDEGVIENMIAAATSENEKEVVLDAKTFARALTHDIEKYNLMNDFSLTTIRDDVFGEEEIKDVEEKFTLPQLDLLAERCSSQLNLILSLLAFVFSYLMRIYFAEFSITSVGDLKGCNGGHENGCKIAQSIVDWLLIMISLVGLGIPYICILNLGNRNPASFTVHLVELVAGIIGVVLLLIVPTFVSFTARPVFNVQAVNDTSDVFTAFPLWVLFVIGLLLLLIKLSSLFHLLFSDTVSKSPVLSALLTQPNVKKEFDVKQSATYKVNLLVKNALELHAGKIDNEHVRVNLNLQKSEPMLNFNAISKEMEPVGGMVWAWKSVMNGEIYSQQGIWINSRIRAGVFFQFIFAMGLICLGILCYQILLGFYPLSGDVCKVTANPESCSFVNISLWSANFYVCDEVSFSSPSCFVTTTEIPYFYEACELANLTECGIFGRAFDMNTYSTPYALVDGSRESEDFCAVAVDFCYLPDFGSVTDEYSSIDGKKGACMLGLSGKVGNACEDKLLDTDRVGTIANFFPEIWLGLWKVKLCVVIATIVGSSWSAYLGATYISSSVSTVLRYRSGVLESLRGKLVFNRNRSSSSAVSVVLGAMFWGDFFSSIVLLILVLVILIVILLPFARKYLLAAVATVLGIGFSLGFKMLLVMLLGKRNTKGFYTSNPIITHMFGVGLECWSLALTSLVMLVRTCKILVAAILFVARIDIPFLADGADKLGPVVLDPYSNFFRQDLLAADAHHHPYIERLGTMYLMMLRHGDEFCNIYGSTWRLLFVFALLPWVQLNRIADSTPDDDEEDGDLEGDGKAELKKKMSIESLRAQVSSRNVSNENTDSLRIMNADLLKEVERLKTEIHLMKEGKVKYTE